MGSIENSVEGNTHFHSVLVDELVCLKYICEIGFMIKTFTLKIIHTQYKIMHPYPLFQEKMKIQMTEKLINERDLF